MSPDPGRTRSVARWAVLLVAFGAFAAYYSIDVARIAWDGDFRAYFAAVHALYADPWLPANEVLAVPGRTSINYTPYLVATALVGKLLGLAPYAALQLAGIVNLLAWSSAIVWFFAAFSRVPSSPWPPVVFLATTLFLRSQHHFWSSETDYLTMKYLQAYPSMLGWSLALAGFVLAERACERTGRAAPILLAVLLAALFLSHSITGSWVFGIVGVRALVALVRSNRSGALRLLAACGGGVVLMLAWPYFSLALLVGFGGVPENAPFGSHPVALAPAAYVLALAGLALGPSLDEASAHVPGRRQPAVAFWLAGFGATALAWLLFRSTGLSYGDRYVYFMLFFPQCVIADATGTAIESLLRRRGVERPRALGALSLAACLAALWIVALFSSPMLSPEMRRWAGTLRDTLARPSAAEAYVAPWTPLAGALAPGDVVMMPAVLASNDVAAITGARVVFAPYRYTVEDWRDRARSIEVFFAPGTAAEARRAELARWGTTKVVLVDESLGVEGEMASLLGPPVLRTSRAAVFDVRSARP